MILEQCSNCRFPKSERRISSVKYIQNSLENLLHKSLYKMDLIIKVRRFFVQSLKFILIAKSCKLNFEITHQ